MNDRYYRMNKQYSSGENQLEENKTDTDGIQIKSFKTCIQVFKELTLFLLSEQKDTKHSAICHLAKKQQRYLLLHYLISSLGLSYLDFCNLLALNG